MADMPFTELSPGSGGSKILDDVVTTFNGEAATPAGVKVQRQKMGFGAAGTFADVTASTPLPVASTLPPDAATDTTIEALADAIVARLGLLGQKDAAGSAPVVIASDQPGLDVAVSNWPSGFEATGPLTNAELRDTPVPVSLGGVSAVTGNPHYDTPSIPVAQRPVEIWAASFADVGPGLLSPRFTQRALGAGVTISQAAGNLVVAAGATARAEFLARSTQAFMGAFIHRVQVALSQRIVNNNFAVMLADSIGEGLNYTINSAISVTIDLPGHTFTAANVGQFMNLGAITGAAGVPGRYAIASVVAATSITFTVAGWPAAGAGTLDLFGWNYYRALYNGIVVTNVNVDAQRQGWASGDTLATILTTAGVGHMLQLNVAGRDVQWADALPASATAPNVSTRASRVANLPDGDTPLYVFLWSFNGTANPASSTNWTVGFVSVEDTVNNPVYIAGAKPSGQGSPLPVQLAPGTYNIGNVVLLAGTSIIGGIIHQGGFTDTQAPLAAGASFTGTGRATTAGFSRFVASATADQAGTLFVERSLDTGATWRLAAQGQPVAAGENREVSVTVTGTPGAATLYRARYVNGGAAQTAFSLGSAFVV